MTTITKQYTTISGNVLKEFKNMIKGHKKGSYPILDNLKIEPSEKEYEIKVTYTNSEIFAVKTFETIESTISSAFLLPIEYIKAVKGIGKGDNFTFELDELYKIHITGKGIKQTIQTFDPEEFPKDYTSGSYSSAGNLFQNDLNKLKAAALSTSVSYARPILNNVLIRDNAIISTDSHRLFKTEINCSFEKDILIHRDLINYIAANEKKDFSSCIHVSDNDVKIITHNASYSYRIDGGNYPDVSRLIPNDFNIQFEVLEFDKFKNTLEAIKAAAINKKYTAIIEADRDKIIISNIENTIKTEIKVYYNQFDSLKMAFDANYLLDALKQIESKNILLNIVSNLRPFIVTDANNKDNSLSLILPVRLTH